MGEFWYPYPLGPWELAPFLIQTNLFAKFELCILSYKTLQGGPYVHNVYKCTHEHTWNHVCEHDEHVYAVFCACI